MINVVVLAAGLGKRMHSSLPKVLQPIAGSPMIHHVLKTVQALPDVSRTVVVIGHGADEVKASLTDFPAVSFALQQPQLGTGHALQQALPLLDPAAEMTLVLLGDVPLIQPTSITTSSPQVSSPRTSRREGSITVTPASVSCSAL